MDAITDITKSLGAALKQRGLILALAESCTGGMAASAVTEAPGSSTWFDRGFVTYSNAAKIEMLNVSAETLEKYGAVSEQVATEMALGALKNSNADITGSITGIAGPTGGSADKPVGLVCFAWAQKNGQLSQATQHFDGNRQQIRQQATYFLLNHLLAVL